MALHLTITFQTVSPYFDAFPREIYQCTTN